MTYDEALAYFADLSETDRSKYKCKNGTERLALEFVNKMLETLDPKMIQTWTERTIGRAKVKEEQNTKVNEDALRLKAFLRGEKYL